MEILKVTNKMKYLNEMYVYASYTHFPECESLEIELTVKIETICYKYILTHSCNGVYTYAYKLSVKPKDIKQEQLKFCIIKENIVFIPAIPTTYTFPLKRIFFI